MKMQEIRGFTLQELVSCIFMSEHSFKDSQCMEEHV